MSTWLDGFFDNAWLKLLRYDPTTKLAKYGNTELKPTRTVEDWTELQEIPKTASNDDLIVVIKSFPTDKQLMRYSHADGFWKQIQVNNKSSANSIMWVGEQGIGGIAGSAGMNPLMIPRKLYYTVSSWTNLSSFIRGFRASHNNSTTGSGTLSFNKANKTLSWKAPGDTTGGPLNDGFGVAVDVSTGGWYRLEAATAGKEVLACVKQANEPASDASDTVSFSGNTPAYANNISTAVGMFNAKYGNPFGERQYYYTMNSLDVTQFWASISQWEGVETDITWLDLLTSSSRGSITNIDSALSTLLSIIKRRQAVGSHVIVPVPFPYNASSDSTITFLPYLTRKLKSLAELHNFDVVDVNRYLIDPAGTITDPMAVSTYLNSGDNQYLSVRGALIYEKYGITPALSKFLPVKYKDEPSLVVYSATETFGNLLTNGKLTGTAGTKGTRVTGDVPTSYTASVSTGGSNSMTAVCTAPDSAAPVARGEGLPGNVFQVVLDNVTNDGEYFTLVQTSNISASNYAAGDVVQLSGELQVAAAGNGLQLFSVSITGTGMSVSALSTNLTSNIPGTLNGDTVLFRFTSMPITLQSGIGNLNISVRAEMKAGGNATLKLSPNFALRKVTY